MNTPLTQTLLLLLLSAAWGLQDYTEINEDNYCLAESQGIFSNYQERIKSAYGSLSPTGTGIWLHNTAAINASDTTVVRPNFDTRYSILLLDLTTPATLTMPKTDSTGRYQSIWFITEDAWNPTYLLNKDFETQTLITETDMGSKYVLALARTQVNMQNSDDGELATQTQLGLKIDQEDPGDYVQSDQWDQTELVDTWRAKYAAYGQQNGVTSYDMFGPKGCCSTDDHNVGCATGWGGLTPERAVYLNYHAQITGPFTLTLTDVPVRAFWSITVYDANGFVDDTPGVVYNVNSAFADGSDGSVTRDIDGSYVINFIDTSVIKKSRTKNKMDTYKTWNFILRLYEPDEVIVDQTWVRPELVKVYCEKDHGRRKCMKDGCKFYKSIKGYKTRCGSFPQRPSTTKQVCESIERQDHCDESGFCKYNNKELSCEAIRCKKLKPSECKETSLCVYKKERCMKKPSSPLKQPCCPAGYNGLKAYAKCRRFYACKDGEVEAEPQKCPETTLFNEEIQVCDFAENVDCDIQACE